MEKRNKQLEHGPPIEQTIVLLCTCDSGVVHCQSHSCHSTSNTSGELVRCSQRIARASDLGSCQSNLCN